MYVKEFAAAQELRQALLLDQASVGPVYRYNRAKTAAVVLSVDDIFLELRKTPMKPAAISKTEHWVVCCGC